MSGCGLPDGRCRCPEPADTNPPALAALIELAHNAPPLCADNALHTLERMAVELARRAAKEDTP